MLNKETDIEPMVANVDDIFFGWKSIDVLDLPFELRLDQESVP